jgi:hypothetical protein
VPVQLAVAHGDGVCHVSTVTRAVCGRVEKRAAPPDTSSSCRRRGVIAVVSIGQETRDWRGKGGTNTTRVLLVGVRTEEYGTRSHRGLD